MKRETLYSIKEEIRRFAKLYNTFRGLSGDLFPHYTTIGVVLQNMGVRGADSPLEEKIDLLYKQLEVLAAFSEYYSGPGNHVEKWVYREVDMIVQGYTMSEELEKHESGVYSTTLED